MDKDLDEHFSKEDMGNSLVVQWLGLGDFTAGAQVRSLAWELRFCKQGGMAKKTKQAKNKTKKDMKMAIRFK